MNCYNECSNFIKNKKPDDLGNITDAGSCAYCLYWKNGPGRPFYNYTRCECNDLFRKVSNLGTTFDVKSYNEVKNCLNNAKNCGVQYYTFTNTPVYYQPIPETVRMPCDSRKIWSPTFKYRGVL